MATVWITKYALTRGIFEAEALVWRDRNMVEAVDPDAPSGRAYYHGSDWHETKLEAELRAETMRSNKIASLRRQIKRLEALTF